MRRKSRGAEEKGRKLNKRGIQEVKESVLRGKCSTVSSAVDYEAKKKKKKSAFGNMEVTGDKNSFSRVQRMEAKMGEGGQKVQISN